MNKKPNTRRKNKEGSIYQLKNGLYCGYVRTGTDENGKVLRKYIYGHSKEEVERKVSDLTGKLSSLKIESLQNSASDLIKEWLLVFKKNEVTSRAFENIMRNFNLHISKHLENVSLIDIDSVVIKKLLNIEYDKTHSLEVVRKVKSILKQFYDYAVEEKLAKYNPLVSIKLNFKEKRDYSIEGNSKKYKAILPEHRKKYLEALTENEFLLTLCCVGYYMGLRIGEILALKWEDIDFKKSTLSINKGLTYEVKFDENGEVVDRHSIISSTKTQSSVATLPMPNIVSDILKNWYKSRGEYSKKLDIDLTDPDCFVFSNDDGSLRSYYGTRAIYNRFLDKNKLPRKEFHFHALRHTFGTILKDNQENILNIQLLLRHASAKTTENYLSTTNQQILSFKNRLDNVFENDLKQYERKTRKKSKDFEM